MYNFVGVTSKYKVDNLKYKLQIYSRLLFAASRNGVRSLADGILPNEVWIPQNEVTKFLK